MSSLLSPRYRPAERPNFSIVACMIMRADIKQRRVATLSAWTHWCQIRSTLQGCSRKAGANSARSAKFNGIDQPHGVADHAHNRVNQVRHSTSVTHPLFTLCLLASLTMPVTGHGEVAAAPEFQLTDTCPASFELIDGGCVLRNRYREYRSLRDAGVGGLRQGCPLCARVLARSRSILGATCSLIPSSQQMAQSPAPAVMTRHRGSPTGVPRR